MRRLSISVVLALSLLGQSKGLEARPIHTSRVQRTTIPRLPLVNVYSNTLSNDRSVSRMRGGSSSSTSLSSLPLSSVNAFLKHHPFIAAFVVCSMKASMADAFAQFLANKRSSVTVAQPFDVKRNLALMCYGGTYQGCGQEYIYNHLFTVLFGAKTAWKTVVTKVSVDMFLVQPLVSLPIAYFIKAVVMKQTMAHARHNYFSDIQHNKLLQTCWLVWIPAQTLVFSVIPKHLRISFIACVSFFWLIIFSTISASKKPSAIDDETTTKEIGGELQLQQ